MVLTSRGHRWDGLDRLKATGDMTPKGPFAFRFIGSIRSLAAFLQGWPRQSATMAIVPYSTVCTDSYVARSRLTLPIS
jgi:hypothetical protein